MHFKQQPWAGFPRQGEIGQMDCLHDLLALLKKMRQLDSELHLIFERISQLKYPIVTDIKKQEGWKDRQSFQVIALYRLLTTAVCLLRSWSFHLHQKHSYPRPKLPQHQISVTLHLKSENMSKPGKDLWKPHLNFGLRQVVIVYTCNATDWSV